MLKYSTYQSIYDKPADKRSHNNKSTTNNRLQYHNRMIKIVVLFVFIMITTTGMVTAFASSNNESGHESYESVIVMPGDTLWEIAVDHKPRGEDTRVYIDAIKRVNHLKVSSIQAGDTLLLPNI